MQRLWDFCDVLRDDGLSYGDYLEQLTYLLFLKMADEQHELLGGERVVPIEHDWQSLLARSGAELEAHYSEALSELGAGDDMLGVVFHSATRLVAPAASSWAPTARSSSGTRPWSPARRPTCAPARSPAGRSRTCRRGCAP